MKTKCVMVTLVLSCLPSAQGGNAPLTREGTKKGSVSVVGLDGEANKLKTILKAKSEMEANKIAVETAELEKFVTSKTTTQGWAAEQITKAVVDIIADANKLLQEKKPLMIQGINQQIDQTIDAAIAVLDSKAEFQADYKYEEGDPDGNEWTAGACNTVGQFNGVSGDATTNMEFEAGAAIAAFLSAPCKLTLGINGSVELDGYNPVRPTSGSGRTITIKATPKWKNKKGGSVGGLAFLGLTLKVEFPGSGTLPDVEKELSID